MMRKLVFVCFWVAFAISCGRRDVSMQQPEWPAPPTRVGFLFDSLETARIMQYEAAKRRQDSIWMEEDAAKRAKIFRGKVFMNTRKIKLEKIGKAAYAAIKKSVNSFVPPKPRVVKNFAEARKMLEGRVVWGKREGDLGTRVLGVVLPNGKQLYYNEGSYYYLWWRRGVSAYYPDENIIHLMSLDGDWYDSVINLTTGYYESAIPGETIYSPSGQYRWTGGLSFDMWYCPRFIEERVGQTDRYRIIVTDDLYGEPWSIIDPSDGSGISGTDMYEMDAFWDGEKILYVRYTIIPWENSYWKRSTNYEKSLWEGIKREQERCWRVTIK